MTFQQNTIVVGLGEIKVSGNPKTILSCLGLGSCIAVCMYDQEAMVGGMAHIVLPFSRNGAKSGGMATKYADVAIPNLLDEMRAHGAVRSRLVVKIAGGAQRLLPGIGDCFNTGERNIEAVKKVLADECVRISAADVGNNKGRSVRLFVRTGRVFVRNIGAQDIEL